MRPSYIIQVGRKSKDQYPYKKAETEQERTQKRRLYEGGDRNGYAQPKNAQNGQQPPEARRETWNDSCSESPEGTSSPEALSFGLPVSRRTVKEYIYVAFKVPSLW